MRYAYLSPKHLRDGMAKTERETESRTERPVETIEEITQEVESETLPPATP